MVKLHIFKGFINGIISYFCPHHQFTQDAELTKD